MKLHDVLSTIQVFQPGDTGDGEQRDLCSSMPGNVCALNIGQHREPGTNIHLHFCSICPLNLTAHLAHDLHRAMTDINSSDH
ncbi:MULTISPECIES: hypothetical protein [Pantoea]|jgi:hypothetical protein|uniref:Uncharacterized protein n=1 Tax=Pantoea brenneri TaxID=472694 RepID=A0A7Y6NH39_9GAMM|nr:MULTISPECIES: hypothetical protein [Pantoea]MBZ6397013.1 hypothetical protein [Pantoea sp.]MBZ6440236.1 hypothetical protein [Pantoea sp.]NUY43402.1 hypothetical protein [Pantoea brenneri]NUY51032.1 hypothetical protein [Pantoea brenneri]NUY61237.1 hypothetical protein [Pantoea brenneri]